jgi:curved DNA-binding protein CbpA
MLAVLVLPLVGATLSPGDDPYAILGVESGATRDAIDASYYRLFRKFDPDHCPEQREVCENHLILINDALEILSSDTRRAAFDGHGEVDPPSPNDRRASP